MVTLRDLTQHLSFGTIKLSFFIRLVTKKYTSNLVDLLDSDNYKEEGGEISLLYEIEKNNNNNSHFGLELTHLIWVYGYRR